MKTRLSFVLVVALSCAQAVFGNGAPYSFQLSQSIDGKTVTCSGVDTTATYTECQDLKVEGLYFPNGISCGPLWSPTDSHYSDTSGFCQSLTGSPDIQVYYVCDNSQPRATWFNHVWSTFNDNGYTQHVRCLFSGLSTVDLSVSKSAGVDWAEAGSVVPFTIVVTNNGTGAASNVVVTDPLPDGMTAVSSASTLGTCSGTTTVTCNVGTLTAGQSATITIDARLPETGGRIVNVATAESDEGDADSADNAGSAGVGVIARVPAAGSLALGTLALLIGAIALALLRGR